MKFIVLSLLLLTGCATTSPKGPDVFIGFVSDSGHIYEHFQRTDGSQYLRYGEKIMDMPERFPFRP